MEYPYHHGADVDTDDLVTQLRQLADAIEQGGAPVQSVSTGEHVDADDIATAEITVEFVKTTAATHMPNISYTNGGEN